MKNGFTLIELLAVIVILAIIALIATPIVLSIIEETKESAVLRSAEHYLSSVEQSIAKKSLAIGGSFSPNTCEVQEGGNLLCDGKDELKIEVNGETPSSGTITFEKGKITIVELVQSNKTITKNEKGELVLGKETEEIKLAPGLYDEKDNLIASWDDLNQKTKTLYGEEYDFAKLIGSGGTYEGVEGGSVGIAAFVIDSIEGASKLVIDGSKIPKSANGEVNIGEHAFLNCENLISVIITEGLTNIIDNAFDTCEKLTSITIPNGIKRIGYMAFSHCESLTNIIIPDSLEFIGDEAFSYCSSLTSINYIGTQTQWDAISKGSSWDIDTPSNKVINYNYTR